MTFTNILILVVVFSHLIIQLVLIFDLTMKRKETHLYENGKLPEPTTKVEGRFFETHMTEARSLNRLRKPMYSKLTNGKSEKVSRTFIRNQNLSIPIAKFMDRRALKFQKLGIPIIELDMASMHEIDNFSESFTSEVQSLQLYKPVSARRIRKNLKKGYLIGGFKEVSTRAQIEIQKISEFHTYHAMIRHMLESIVRMVNMADIYIDLAEQKGVKSPRRLSRQLLSLHINALPGCMKLDKLSAPIQASGIPIIHQDVPSISPYPANISHYLNDSCPK